MARKNCHKTRDNIENTDQPDSLSFRIIYEHDPMSFIYGMNVQCTITVSPSAFSRRAVVSWRKYVHDNYRGRKTTLQNSQQFAMASTIHLFKRLYCEYIP